MIKNKIKILMLCFPQLFILSCSAGNSTDRINGGFEESVEDSDDPIGWSASYVNPADNDARLLVDDREAYSGSKSIMISISKNTLSSQNVYKWVKRIDGLQASGVYEISAWIKVKGIKNSPLIEVQCWGRQKILGRTSSEKVKHFTGTKNWQNVKMIFSIPSGTVKVLLFTELPGKENEGGTVWFDDVVVKKVR